MNDALFLRALRGEDTARAPVWFMRQAGRSLPEYRELKKTYTFWDLARTPELACEVTMQPIRRYATDAAILFQDIMTPLPPMGVEIDFRPGPVIEAPIRTRAAVDALRVPEAEEIAPFVSDAIRHIRAECPVPLIGFGGAPLTLATYLVQGQGSKEYEELRRFLRVDPSSAHALLEKLTEVSIRYLRQQVKAGAQAIQLFDSWAGLHDPIMYAEFAAPYNARVMEGLADLGVPRIFLAVGALHLFDVVATIPCEAVSIDWRQPISVARERLPGKVIQGNLDPSVLLASPDRVRAEVERVLRSGLGGPHVFNLGHGMFKQADPENVLVAIDTVKAFDRHAA